MARYLLLVAPSANRVYSTSAPTLLANELTVLADAYGLGVASVQPVIVAGVDYLQVDTAADLTPEQLRVVAYLSSVHALYQQVGDLLAPVELPHVEVFGSDLVTILKYQGKTNEAFTRLLLNVTAAATARPERLLDRSLSVLDPLCGRGTTLNQALAYGLDATGIDLDTKDFEVYDAFVRTYLKQGRYKHHATTGAIRIDSKVVGRRLDVELAADKDDYKAGRTQHLTVLRADTLAAPRLLRAESAHVVVTDTPYGVQHGSHGGRLDRSPLGLLDAALPGWVRVLRTGGALGLAYNRHVADPEALAEVLTRHGLTLVDRPGYDGFRHRVDAAIDRDLVVARKR